MERGICSSSSGIFVSFTVPFAAAAAAASAAASSSKIRFSRSRATNSGTYLSNDNCANLLPRPMSSTFSSESVFVGMQLASTVPVVSTRHKHCDAISFWLLADDR